jgi:hypothetical protein
VIFFMPVADRIGVGRVCLGERRVVLWGEVVATKDPQEEREEPTVCADAGSAWPEPDHRLTVQMTMEQLKGGELPLLNDAVTSPQNTLANAATQERRSEAKTLLQTRPGRGRFGATIANPPEPSNGGEPPKSEVRMVPIEEFGDDLGRSPRGTVIGARPLGPRGTIVGVRMLGPQFRIVSTAHGGRPNLPPEIFATLSPRSKTWTHDVSSLPLVRPVVESGSKGSAWWLIPTIMCFILAAALIFMILSDQRMSERKLVIGRERTITPFNVVSLAISPPGALVVGEDDGRILGPEPLELLVPSGAETAVLLHAKGYEPLRLLLPDRGRISAQLTPIPANQRCEVTVDVPAGMLLEGVGFQIDPTSSKIPLPGAGIVRGTNEHGAWILRCPSLGGAERRRISPMASVSARLSVSDPVGAKVSIEGQEAGVAPLQKIMTPGFVKVRIETKDDAEERWVPAFTDIALRMTKPL